MTAVTNIRSRGLARAWHVWLTASRRRLAVVASARRSADRRLLRTYAHALALWRLAHHGQQRRVAFASGSMGHYRHQSYVHALTQWKLAYHGEQRSLALLRCGAGHLHYHLFARAFVVWHAHSVAMFEFRRAVSVGCTFWFGAALVRAWRTWNEALVHARARRGALCHMLNRSLSHAIQKWYFASEQAQITRRGLHRAMCYMLNGTLGKAVLQWVSTSYQTQTLRHKLLCAIRRLTDKSLSKAVSKWTYTSKKHQDICLKLTHASQHMLHKSLCDAIRGWGEASYRTRAARCKLLRGLHHMVNKSLCKAIRLWARTHQRVYQENEGLRRATMHLNQRGLMHGWLTWKHWIRMRIPRQRPTVSLGRAWVKWTSTRAIIAEGKRPNRRINATSVPPSSSTSRVVTSGRVDSLAHSHPSRSIAVGARQPPERISTVQSTARNGGKTLSISKSQPSKSRSFVLCMARRRARRALYSWLVHISSRIHERVRAARAVQHVLTIQLERGMKAFVANVSVASSPGHSQSVDEPMPPESFMLATRLKEVATELAAAQFEAEKWFVAAVQGWSTAERNLQRLHAKELDKTKLQTSPSAGSMFLRASQHHEAAYTRIEGERLPRGRMPDGEGDSTGPGG